MLAANLFLVALVTSVAWWLSGYDTKLTGEDEKADLRRRLVKCAITAVLIGIAAFGNRFVAVPIFASLGIYWARCGAEFGSQQFHKLIDPQDDRPFDPRHAEQGLEKFAQLVQQGRTREALDLCQQLEHSRDVSALGLETAVHRFYQDTLDSIAISPVLLEARRLRELRQFSEAESQLKSILASQPDNAAAILMLMRVYAEDMEQPGRAQALIEPADQRQPRLHPAFMKYAQKSIQERSRAGVGKAADGQPPISAAATQPHPQALVTEVSVDELLKGGQLSTAVELLENATRQEPDNFDVWMKLAEVHAVYCADHNRAGKIIQKMLSTGAFTAEEIQLAKTKLREWQKVRQS